uniref:hypothetical protein n=1 Tax=Xanthomonas euvesicatoria TaxID=456327 RepID=UPI001B800905
GAAAGAAAGVAAVAGAAVSVGVSFLQPDRTALSASMSSAVLHTLRQEDWCMCVYPSRLNNQSVETSRSAGAVTAVAMRT